MEGLRRQFVYSYPSKVFSSSLLDKFQSFRELGDIVLIKRWFPSLGSTELMIWSRSLKKDISSFVARLMIEMRPSEVTEAKSSVLGII